MPERFKNHINKFAPISDAEFAAIREYVEIRTFRKKENLLTEGQICRSHFFVLQGLLRQFFINEKGQEQTTEFAIENWWITDQLAFESQTASGFSIQAVEKSEVLIIHRDAQEALFREHPIMERYFRFIYQRAFAAAQRRVQYIFSLSKEEFYFSLLDKYPDFVQRVPQYLIASFLGFTPEYLSEIRRKRIS